MNKVYNVQYRKIFLEYPQAYPVALAYDSIAFNRESVVFNAPPSASGVPALYASVKVRKEFPETWIWDSIDNDRFVN